MVTLEKREGQLQQELHHVHRGIQKIEEEEKKISLAPRKKKKQLDVSDDEEEEVLSDTEDSGWGSDGNP